MTKIYRLFKVNLLAVMLIAVMTAAVYGQPADVKPVAEEMISSNGIYWAPKVNYSQLVLTISRPDGTVFRQEFDTGSTPNVGLSGILGYSAMDGSYTYELRAIPTMEMKVRGVDDSFSTSQAEVMQSVSGELTQTGSFYVKNGGIVSPNMTEMQSSQSFSSGQEGLSGTLDQVIADDLIVQMSLCVGVDCVNNENFGFDTIRLKENNLRIHFDDTSNSGSFPSNDWRITINDTNNGGASYFQVDDATNSKSPFTIEANTPSNTLYVDNAGRVGIGTATPVLDAHIAKGNTPGLRLEQNGSSGFTAQTWDIAGNEANFFVRDVTHSSHLVFRIKPSAPENSIFIDTDGVGFGTSNPGFPVHLVTDSSTNAAIVAQRTGGATNFMNATATLGVFGTTTDNDIRFVRNSVQQMDLIGNSDIAMQDGGGYNGTWNNASSRALKENIKDLTADDAMKALDGLTPVTYNYKADKEEEHVGFIAEDVPDLVAAKDRKSLSSMDIVSVLTKVVQEQQRALDKQQQTISSLEAKVAQLEKDTH